MANVVTVVGAGAILPRISFRQIGAPGTVWWNQGTMASVILVPHVAACPECARYLQEFGTAVEALRGWATRAMMLAAATPSEPAPPGVFVLDDSAGTGRAALGLAADQAAVVQADRYGAVYQVAVAGPHGDLPAPHELVGLAQYIDIQCPECGVPSKEWLTATPFPLG